MRVISGALLAALIVGATAMAGTAQTPNSGHQASPWTRYCQPDDGFCFRYPGSWKMLGPIFNGNGVVVAPVQKLEESLWNEITVAMIAPPPSDGQEPLGLNGVIEQAAAGMRDAGQNFQTLQRQQRTVNGKPAELLKAQYREKSSGRDWVEEIVFIEGPDSEIYSVALKSAPENLGRLEPVFAEVLRTWSLPEPQPPVALDGPATEPGTSSSETPTAPPHRP